MRQLELQISLEQFHQLPRNAAYKYEYLHGSAWLSPRPRYYHTVLDLMAMAQAPPAGAHSKVHLRPLQPDDWEGLAVVFAAAFRTQQPFAGLEDEARREAARQALAHTRTGGDGPWIELASFVATTVEGDLPLGSILVTLLPPRDLTEWDSYHWHEPPPPDAIERRLGQPHLTWIYVSPSFAGCGIGTALLNATVRELLALGYGHLASTFLIGNDSSMLWHWRNGFRLLAYPGSKRSARPANG
jgi:GNAT superfamily N-acetyltransferase